MRIQLLICTLFLWTACQNSPTTPAATQTTTTPAAKEVAAPKPIAPNTPLPNISDIQQTQPLTVYMQKKMAEKIWHYKTAVVINNPEKSKYYNGKWVKFNPDNTLMSGFYEEAGSPGRWVYDEGKDILTVMEGGERPSYTQWKVKFSENTNDVQIWVGTTRFQNNSTQIKMIRSNEKPVK